MTISLLTTSHYLSLWGAAIIGAVGGVLSFSAWQVYAVPRLVLHEHELEVRNPLHKWIVPASCIASVRVSNRLVLNLTDGGTLGVWAVQAANISLMLRRRSFVDDVAAAVEGWLNEQGPSRVAVSSESQTAIDLRLLAIVVALSAGGAVLLRMLM